MGRYIYMGIATSYVAYTERIDKYLTSSVLEDIRTQLSPDIYEFSHHADRLEWILRKDIPITDLTELLRSFSNLYHYPKEKDLDPLINQLSSMNFEQAILYANQKNYYCYQAFDLDPFLYYYPFTINGERVYLNTKVSTIIIADSCFKTYSENDIRPYDFFTELLRYRMKPLKLADSLLVYLSQ